MSYNRLERLQGRRIDPEVIGAKQLNEVYKRISQSDSVKYVLGAMQPIDPEYTKATYAEGDRVWNQLEKNLTITCELRYQGSVTNDTHIKAKSDIDLLTVIGRFFTLEQPQEPSSPYQGDPIQDLRDLRKEEIQILDRAFLDPVFNLSVRDNLVGWTASDRSNRLVNILDAYVLGAVPPYNMLLGGKAIACLVRSREVYDDFAYAYGSTTGIISGEEKRARLLAVTTSSSMGRSSLYNRLKLDGVQYYQSIGYTVGWGHFHITDDLFVQMRDYLRLIEHPYADCHRFGQGPNWRLRTIRAALGQLGINETVLRHGIQREVFFCPLAKNALHILASGKENPDLSDLRTVTEISDLARKRWIEPRASNRNEYKLWNREDIPRLIRGEFLVSSIRKVV